MAMARASTSVRLTKSAAWSGSVSSALWSSLPSAPMPSSSPATASASRAMEIRQFDRMSVQDQGDYITVLIDGAQQVLIDTGHRDLADKVDKLFTEVLPGDQISLGMAEFERNLARARVADLQRVIKDPNARRRLEVEDAMAVTLQANGIELPDSFFTVAKRFRPQHPAKS